MEFKKETISGNILNKCTFQNVQNLKIAMRTDNCCFIGDHNTNLEYQIHNAQRVTFKNVYANKFDHYKHKDASKPHPHPYAPGFLYHTGVEPLLPFTFKGVIWYQGESNVEFTKGKFKINGQRLSDYQTTVMKTLVADWRSAFKNADLPFYMVQLPRISAPNRVLWPYYREAQARVAKEIKGCELARVMEFGVKGPDVHPPLKEPVAERLAAIAKAKLYGKKVPYSGPVYKSYKVSGKKSCCHLNTTTMA